MIIILLIVTVMSTILLYHFRKTLLFLMSFTPLFWILLIKVLLESVTGQKNWKSDFASSIVNSIGIIFGSYFWVAIIILGIVPWIAWAFTICKVNKSITSVSVMRVEKMGDNIVSYVMTYIVPLTSLSFSSSISEYTSNVLLFVLIMVLYIRLDLVYLNPILIILGWNTYHIVGENGDSFLLTKSSFSTITSITKPDGMNDACELQVSKLSNNLNVYTK